MGSGGGFRNSKCPSSNFYQMHFRKIRSVRGVSTLRSLSILEEALELLIINPMSPLQSLHDHPFSIDPICAQGVTCNPCPEGCGRVVILNYIISGPFNYVEQKGYLKILIECVRRNGGHERGVSCPQITFEY